MDIGSLNFQRASSACCIETEAHTKQPVYKYIYQRACVCVIKINLHTVVSDLC